MKAVQFAEYGGPEVLAVTDVPEPQPGSGQIRLTWSAATDNTAVTGYDIYANSVLRSSVAGTVTGTPSASLIASG